MKNDYNAKKAVKLLKKIGKGFVSAVDKVVEYIDPTGPLTKVVAPYSRQSFADNVRKSNRWD